MKPENWDVDLNYIELRNLLDNAINTIADNPKWPMFRHEVLRLLALPIGLKPESLYKCLKGKNRRVPPEQQIIIFLARMCWRKGMLELLGSNWPEKFLRAGHFPDPEKVLLKLHKKPPSDQISDSGPIFGREDDLANILPLLIRDARPLVNIIGPPGVGKTHLALEIANWLLDAYDDGVFWVEMNNISTLQEAYLQIAKSMKIPNSNSADIKSLENDLKGWQTLIIFDNCDDIQLARKLSDDFLSLRPAAEIQMIFTSREKLSENDEYILRPLSYPDSDEPYDISKLEKEYGAVAFLAYRMRQTLQKSRIPYQITENNAHPIITLCAAMDGLPGALELWAPTCAKLSVAHVLKLLEEGQRPQLTKPTQIKRPFYESIALIYSLLNRSSQQLFNRLAVFPGNFLPEAVKNVCSVSGDLDADINAGGLNILEYWNLFQLVQGSDGAVRYRLLQPIRDFALERLKETGEYETILANHAEHYLKLTEKLHKQPLWRPGENEVRVVKAEFHNLRAAVMFFQCRGKDKDLLRIASSLAMLWSIAYHMDEIQTILKQTLERVEAGQSRIPEKILARAYLAAAVLAWSHGQLPEAKFFTQKSLEYSEKMKDEIMIIYSKNYLGTLARSQGEWKEADDLYQECLERCEKLGDKTLIAMEEDNQGNLWRLQRLFDEGIQKCSAALLKREDQGDLWGQAGSYLSLALLYLGKKQFKTASEKAYIALQMYIRAEALWDRAYACETLAQCACSQMRPLLTAKLLGAAKMYREEGGFTLPSNDNHQPELILDWARNLDSDAMAAYKEGLNMSPAEGLKTASALLRKCEYGLNPTQAEIVRGIAKGRSREEVMRATKIEADKFPTFINAISKILEIKTRLPAGITSPITEIILDETIREAIRELDAQI